jgi:hypothetical protein
MVKQPTEVIDYDISFAAMLKSLSTPDELLKVTASVDLPELLLLSATVNGTSVKVWCSGGVSGATYKVTVLVETKGHRVIENEFKVKVKAI